MTEKKRQLDSISALLSIVGADRSVKTSGSRPVPRRLFRGQAVDRPLLPRFAREASDRGLANVLQTERRLLDDFSRLALPYLGSLRPQNVFEWLAVAQHHGVPTRLLDWTGNPLFALWFAVREDPKDGAGAFWVLRVADEHLLPLDVQTDVYDLKRTYVFRPAHITMSIVAQDGWFTAHWYIEAKDKFVPLERQPRFVRHLQRYVIPPSAFSALRSGLRRLGISDAVLFPDLLSLSTELVTRVFPERRGGCLTSAFSRRRSRAGANTQR